MGLLDFWGSTDTDEEQRRRKQLEMSGGLLGAPEPPSAMARIGRGMMDIGEPLWQGVLNAQVWNPEAAEDYRKGRADDERLYRKGLYSDSNAPAEVRALYPDAWRVAGQSAALIPFWTAGGLLRAGQGIPSMYQAAIEAPAAAELWRMASNMPEVLRYLLKTKAQR